MYRNIVTPVMISILLALTSQSFAQNEQEARSLLNKVSETYQHMKRYYLEGSIVVEMEATTGGSRGGTERSWKKGDVWKMEKSFITAIVRPDKMRGEMNDPSGNLLIVSNGEMTWTSQFIPQLKQYTVNKTTTAFGRTYYAYERITERVKAATILREESVEIGGQSVDCTVIEVQWKPNSQMQTFEGSTRTFWIDRSRHLVLREVSNAKFLTNGIFVIPLGGPIKVTQQTTTFRIVKVDEPIPDTLFVFTPPEGAKQAESLVRQEVDLSGTEAIDFMLNDLDGKELNLKSLRGKVVLLDFWASWCSPCRAELPSIEKLHREFKNKGLVVLGVDSEDPENARAFLKEHHYTFLTLVDVHGQVAEYYRVQGIPTVLVIDREGTIRAHKLGMQSESELRAALKQAGIEQ